MHPMVNIALRAARDVGQALAHAVDRLDRIAIIQDDSQGLLTSMDQEADQTILHHLSKAHPGHTIESRVSGRREGKDSDTVWLIDPLLGNRNFINGHCQFAVSIACQIKGVITHAVLINPLLQEEFITSRGGGARLNVRRIRCSQTTDLHNTLIGLNASGLDIEVLLQLQKNLAHAGAHLRLSGCSALDMVYTASGHLAGGWCAGMPAASLAAADLILRESGAFIGDATGGPDYRKADELVFGNPKLFRELVKIRGRSS